MGYDERMFRIPASIVLVLVLGTIALAHQWPPRTDSEVAALDLKTGKVLWVHKPQLLGDAHFEVFAEGLVV
jgi:hypothetical protein